MTTKRKDGRRSIYREDIAEVNAKLDAIYTQLEKILKRLAKIK